MTTNKDRAHRIDKIALNYLGEDNNHPDDFEAAVRDILADVRHWCDKHGKSFADIDRIAYNNYSAEVSEFGVAK